jgi:hypothetical protein
VTARDSYRAAVGSQHADLPIVPLNDDLAIALAPAGQLSRSLALVASPGGRAMG